MRLIFIAILLLPMLALTGCRKDKPAPSKKARREEAQARASGEQLATTRFAEALRAVIDWRQTQPTSSNTLTKDIATRLHAIPAKDLPSDLAGPWSQVLAADDDKAKCQAAASQLNEALAKHGFIDLRL